MLIQSAASWLTKDNIIRGSLGLGGPTEIKEKVKTRIEVLKLKIRIDDRLKIRINIGLKIRIIVKLKIRKNIELKIWIDAKLKIRIDAKLKIRFS